MLPGLFLFPDKASTGKQKEAKQHAVAPKQQQLKLKELLDKSTSVAEIGINEGLPISCDTEVRTQKLG